MSRIKGRDVQLYLDGKVVALATSCELDVQCDMVAFTSSTSKAKRQRPGRYRWAVTCNALFSNEGEDIDLLKCLTSRQKLTITMLADTRTSMPISGEAYVQSWHENAPLAGMANYSVQFAGDGEIAYT